MIKRRYAPVLLLLLAAALLAAPASRAQEDEASDDRFELSGFLKVDAFYDTRQTVAAREGEFLLYPLPVDEQPRLQGEGTVDVNGRDNLNASSFYSRLRLGIDGPAFLGGETSGVVEGDFLGTADGLENVLRLRHAFVQMDWDTHAVVVGQYWSPLFVTQVFPQTVSFNLGVPMHPLARFPQVRLTVHPTEQVTLVGALTAQRDAFQDIAGRTTQQQSGVPGAHLHAQFNSGALFAGAGGYLRTVRPELSGERVTSGAASGYARLQSGDWALRTQVLYGTNMADHLMLGGYARTSGAGQPVAFRNLQTLAAWADLSAGWGRFSAGLFGGYTTNLGTLDDVPASASVAFQARGADLAYVWRVSPRIQYDVGRLRLALEAESTTALYGAGRAANLEPEPGENEPVTNLRGLFSVFLFL